MKRNRNAEAIILDSSAPIDEGGRNLNIIYVICTLVIFFLLLGSEASFNFSLLGGMIFGSMFGWCIKQRRIKDYIWYLSHERFVINHKIPYDRLIGELQPVLMPLNMFIEKNVNGEIIVTYEKVPCIIRYNADNSFSIYWNKRYQSGIIRTFGSVYRCFTVAVGIIAYNIQQIDKVYEGEIKNTVSKGGVADAPQIKNKCFCIKCGAENDKDNVFCMNCGGSLVK